MDGVLRRRGENAPGRKSREDGGRDWSDTSNKPKSTKGYWEPPEAKQQQGSIWASKLRMEGMWPADTLVLNF